MLLKYFHIIVRNITYCILGRCDLSISCTTFFSGTCTKNTEGWTKVTKPASAAQLISQSYAAIVFSEWVYMHLASSRYHTLLAIRQLLKWQQTTSLKHKSRWQDCRSTIAYKQYKRRADIEIQYHSTIHTSTEHRDVKPSFAVKVNDSVLSNFRRTPYQQKCFFYFWNEHLIGRNLQQE